MRKWWLAILIAGFGWIGCGNEPWSFVITGGRMRGTGSAVRWEGQPVVVTAAHVVVDNPGLRLTGGDGKEYAVRSVELAPDRDLAILETVELPPFGPAVWRFGLDAGVRLSDGGVSYQPVKITPQEINFIGLHIRPGESGGAVAGERGGIVGVLRGRRREGEEAIAVRIDNYIRHPEAVVSLRQLEAWQEALEQVRKLDRQLQAAAQTENGGKLRERAAAILKGFFPAAGFSGRLREVYLEALKPLCMAAAWLGLGLDGTFLTENGEYHHKTWDGLFQQYGVPDFECVRPDSWGIVCWRLSGNRLCWGSFCEAGPFSGRILFKTDKNPVNFP